MRTMKFALILPVIQLFIAAVLLEWGYQAPWPFPPHGDELYVPTSRMICMGINAPAWLLGVLLSALPLPNVSVYRLHTSDFEFLAATILVWYFAGRVLDARALLQKPQVAVGTALWNLLLVVVGACLFASALATLRSPRQYSNLAGSISEGILFLTWSFVLIVFPAIHVFRAVVARRSNPESMG